MYAQGEITNGVRAYVRGEGLWAKAQKDAIYFLIRYAATGDERDYQQFNNVLLVPLGDKQARLALQTQPPDREQAKAGFLTGQNHPEDVDALVEFFLNFKNVSYMREAIRIWTDADQLILQLQQLAEAVHRAQVSGDNGKRLTVLDQLPLLNERLTNMENEFSLVLGEGARWIKRTTLLISLMLLIVILWVVLLASAKIIKTIVKTEHDLLRSENRFRSLVQSDLLGIVAWHVDGRILEANNAFLEMLGIDKHAVDEGGINWRTLTPDSHTGRDFQALEQLAKTGVCAPYEKELYHVSGERIPVYLGAALLDGEQEQGICFVMDLSERKRNETQLRLAATVFDASREGIMITDSRLRIVAVNAAFTRLTGHERSDLLGRTPKALRSGLMQSDFYSQMWAELETNGHWQGDILDRKQNGSVLPVSVSISAVRDSTQQLSHFVAIYSDISARKALEEQLQQQAHYDFLTGLANRNLLTDRIQQEIERSTRSGHMFAILFFDLDHFKPVNDTYGHAVGDKLLQEIAKRLRTTVRGNDSIIRHGGDEFVIVVTGLKRYELAAKVAAKIIDAIKEPCLIDNHEIHIGGSIGISVYPEHGNEPLGLLNCADSAMYIAKTSGRNCYSYYESIIDLCN